MGDEDPPNLKEEKESLLERMIKIDVVKHPEPIITPEMCREGVTSARNPAAIKYNGNYILPLTIRSVDTISRIHLSRSTDGINFQVDRNPFINTDRNSTKGVEDPRAVKINGEYYITFTAFKGKELDKRRKKVNTTRIGFVKTKDFETYYDRKIILDQYGNNKNCVIFQNRDPGFYVIHRPFFGGRKERAAAHIAKTKDFETWEDTKIFLEPREGMWDSERVGVNTPPILIKLLKNGKFRETFFILYHGADKENIYRMGYILVDPNNPTEILERSEEALISPDKDSEIGRGLYNAEKKNVVFGQGTVPYERDIIRAYYGGADMCIHLADLILKNAEVLEHSRYFGRA